MTYPILITGASRGLGAALALKLARNFHIIAVAKTTGSLEELDDRIQAIGGQATLAPLDLTDVNAVHHLCISIMRRHVRTLDVAYVFFSFLWPRSLVG